ncbi:LOW QUALITY PROTEIN: SAM dependent carboxyl methyltransferase [Dillenia turbinata]|uniref:SAM dependent carboxyl methyltransferase n=1 Tax=Dillenia turbinata TaxID=194707 RepID=A0AAN8USZ7_9MAGN
MGPSRLTLNMDAEKGFRMTGGAGDTSHAKNSSMQVSLSLSLTHTSASSLCTINYRRRPDMGKHIRPETIQQLYISTTPTNLRIADLGCSSGPNTLSFIKDIIEIQRVKEFLVLCHIFTRSYTRGKNEGFFRHFPDLSMEGFSPTIFCTLLTPPLLCIGSLSQLLLIKFVGLRAPGLGQARTLGLSFRKRPGSEIDENPNFSRSGLVIGLSSGLRSNLRVRCDPKNQNLSHCRVMSLRDS